MEFKCKICNNSFKSLKSLKIHIKLMHNLNYYNYAEKYENFKFPKCPYCNNNVFLSKNGLFRHTCENELCKSKYRTYAQLEAHKNNPQLRINARNRRINYLKNNNNFITTAWGKRANHELSFLELWFIDNVINKYKLYEKYDIINEYSFNKYFLDFAFLNIKLDIELDGKCHFINGNDRVQHDIERDEYLIKNGWKVYRISYLDINNENTITNFIKMLYSNNILYDKQYYNNIIDGIEFNKKQKEIEKENKLKLKTKNKEHIINIIKKLEKSNIDFLKFGWVTKANTFLKENGISISPNQTRRYIKRHYPNFFNNIQVYTKNIKTT